MLRRLETYWLCFNKNCGKTQPCEETERELETRMCVCGNGMKKVTHGTVFSYLNFLQESGSNETAKKEEEETPCDRSLWTEQPCEGKLRWS